MKNFKMKLKIQNKWICKIYYILGGKDIWERI